MSNSSIRGIIHVIAGAGGAGFFFATLPSPANIYVGAVWAGVVAFAAFLDQSISR